MTTILLTIDVEDWFQVENLRKCNPFEQWENREIRVEQNTLKLLDLFDGFDKKIETTFFVLGWVAERFPGLVKEIINRGHEVASHGYSHNLCTNLSADEFKEDIIKSKELLEDITGKTIEGYRAPNFSVDDGYLSLINQCGFSYDSSYNSFAGHGRYGKLHLSHLCEKGNCIKIQENFFELPVSNLKISQKIIPWGGGGYFRLVPPYIFNKGINYILKKQGAYIFYMHPWEIDPGQPVVNDIPLSYKFRHYVNLDKTILRLENMINRFISSDFLSCSNYLKTFD